MDQEINHKIKMLKEKLILSALKEPEFLELLKETVSEINLQAKKVRNESTLVTIFELELYGLLKNINFKFMPEKEVEIETIRHVKKGRMDSKIGGVVIEYKHRTKLSTDTQKNKATIQLTDYLIALSKDNSLQYYGFITDGIICKEIVCENEQVVSESSYEEFSHNKALQLIRNIVLSDKIAFTPESLIRNFCNDENNIAHNMSRELFSVLKNKQTPKTKMLRLEWEELFKLGHKDKSQQRRIHDRQTDLQKIMSCTFKESEEQYAALFALQTTYAIIIKLIAYRIISELRFDRPLKNYHTVLRANRSTLRIFCQKLEDGEIFRDLGMLNLLEGDFFSWYSDSNQWNSEISDFIRQILQILASYENTDHVFKSENIVDLFKGLYENIIPHTIRASLGEFYTPVWLAEHVFRSVQPKNNSWRGLDPCAGSGTFVLVMIEQVLKELKNEKPETQLELVLKRVNAIDLNPLSVLTTRINYFIRISHLIPKNTKLTIPVYLGDASHVPQEIITESGVKCLKYVISTLEKPIDITLPKSLTMNPQNFSEIMTEYEKKIKAEDKFAATSIILDNIPKRDIKEDVVRKVNSLTADLIYLEKKKWNGIWARIITNFFITANLDRCDIIIGNPPWIDWKNLPSGYREKIKSLCVDRKLFSGDGITGGINLNVCALITSISIENWLTTAGKLAFLMPKVIAFQQSYDGFRQFRSDNIKRDFHAFYDWTKAGHPFYPVTEKFMTYVIGLKAHRPKVIPVKLYIKKSGTSIAGNIHLPYAEAMKRLDEKNAFADQIMPHNTAFTITDKEPDLSLFKKIAGKSTYIGREGIEFYPQELLLFQKATNEPAEPSKGCVYVENIQVNNPLYNIPKDIIEFEKKYLFPLVKGPKIQKFHHAYSGIVTLFPYDKSNPRMPLKRTVLSKNAPKTLDYFIRYQDTMMQQTNFSDRIRGNRGEFYGLARVGLYSFAKYRVGFRDNTKWCACVISPVETFWGEKKQPVFQNHAPSICEDNNGNFIDEDEAHYICAILNAPIVEKYIVQSSDLRSFKIRPPIKIPKFNPNNILHVELSSLSKNAHLKQLQLDEILSSIQKLYLQIL